MQPCKIPPVALTIAGSDSGGGAGIQADLKTFSALGVFGMSAVTAITSQNTTGVSQSLILPPELVVSQIRDVVTDIGCQAAKTGMLGNSEVVSAVAEVVAELNISPLVVDPVMVAKSGASLLQDDAVETIACALIPLATVLTPNIPEAERLLGCAVTSLDEMQEAAEALGRLGPEAVVLKGGHAAGDAVDVLWLREGSRIELLPAPRLPAAHTHGTGCVFSAAIAAHLARGKSIVEAVRRAKLFVTAAIRYGLPLGRGTGPANVLAAGSMLPPD